MDLLASIVIPVKSQQDEWLDQCVRSALRQSASCEVIVVRSAVTPASNLQVLESLRSEYRHLDVIVEENAGSFPGAINLGIRSATTSRIGLLLSDDWLETDAVAQCLPYGEDIVCTGLTGYLADGVTVHPGSSATLTMARYSQLASLQERASYLQHFFLFQREALIQAGGLDETIGNFPGIDDYDLIWTLLERDATVAIVEQRLYNYRDHEGERLTLANADEAVRNLETILRKHRVPSPQLEQLLKDHSRWYGRPIYDVLAEDVLGEDDRV
jgi:glycosyltransferase involved in cell wall biosynthesis